MHNNVLDFLMNKVQHKLKGQIPPGTILKSHQELDSNRIIIELIIGITQYWRAYSQEQLNDSPLEFFIENVTDWVTSCLQIYNKEKSMSQEETALLEHLKSDKPFNSKTLQQIADMFKAKITTKEQEKLKYKISPPSTWHMTEELLKSEILLKEQITKKDISEWFLGMPFPGKVFDLPDTYVPLESAPITDVRIMQAILVILLMTPHDMLPKDDEPLKLTKELIDNVLANFNVTITRDGPDYIVRII